MSSLQENLDWAKAFNHKIDKTLGDDRLREVFADQKKLQEELMVAFTYIHKLLDEKSPLSEVDIAKAQRHFFLRTLRSLSTLESLVFTDYLVFLVEAKARMIECAEFRDFCLSKMPRSNLIPHQFTQSVLLFVALLSTDVQE